MSTESLNRVAGVLDAQARKQEKSDQRNPGPLVTELKSWLADWRIQLEAGKVSDCFLDAGDAGALARGLEEVETRVLRWAPEYAGFVEVFEGKLRVVALTDWEDGVVMEHGSQLVLSSVARGHFVMEVTSLDGRESAKAIMGRVEQMMKACQKLEGSKNREDGGREGNHKTPGFLWTLVMAAYDAADSPPSTSAPNLENGHPTGFRDVGRHSGTVQPSTRWSLLVECLKIALGEDGGILVLRLEAELSLRLAEEGARIGMDLALARIKLAKRRAVVVGDIIPTKRSKLVDRLHAATETLEARLKCMGEKNDADCGPVFGALTTFDASGVFNGFETRSTSGSVMSNIEQAARQELSSAGVAPSHCTISANHVVGLPEFAVWCLAAKSNQLLVLEEIERVMIVLASIFLGGEPESVLLDESSADTVSVLARKFSRCAAAHASNNYPSNGGSLRSMHSELSSRAALVTWIAYSLIYGASCRKHRALRDFSPTLDPKELVALILPERDAQNALKLVVSFLLRARSRGRNVLGGTETRAATFDFGVALAVTLPQALKEVDREQASQEEQITLHLTNVQERKLVLAKHRESKNLHQSNYLRAESRLNAAPYRSSVWLTAKKESNEAQEQMKKSDRSVEKYNTPVTIALALPYDTPSLQSSVALGKCCPKLIGLLCSIGAAAKDLANNPMSHTSLKLSPLCSGENVSLWVDGKRSWWHQKLDLLDYYSNRLDGVKVYRGPQLQTLSGNEDIDVHSGRTRRSFESSLCARDPRMNVPVTFPAADATRGNVSIAGPMVDMDAGRTDKEACQAMWGLRADALQQPRKLIDLLRDKRLPLGSREWVLVTKHMMFQVGPCEDGRFSWRADWRLREAESVEMLRDVLAEDLSTLSSRQSDRNRLLFISRVAAFFGQWHTNVREVARGCAEQAMTWAKEIRQDFKLRTQQGGFKEAAQKSLRAEEYMCLGVVVLANGHENVTYDCDGTDLLSDIDMLAAASARMSCCLALASRDTQRGWEVQEMRHAVFEILARRAKNLDCAQAATSAAAAALGEVIPSSSWTPMRDLANAYSCSAGGGVVHVCTLTGIVLRNGAPPGQLPVTILESHIYKRSFGGFFFETKPGNTMGSYDALYLEGEDLRYSFCAGKDISIEEKQERVGGHHLRLIGELKLGLPPRISMATAAWVALDGDKETVLRGKRYWDRNVHFVCSKEGEVCRVPLHLRRPNWRGISWESPREILMTDLSVGRNELSRFEKLDFIHSFLIEGTSKVKHELVRYGLRFIEENSAVHSLDWPGWSLCMQGDLPGTLHSLSQFIFLRKQCQRKLLVPDGTVNSSEGVPTSIAVSQAAFRKEGMVWEMDPFLLYHEFNMHPRFHSLVAKSRAGRLQLAALYTASELSLRVPDKMERRAGTYVALELMRQLDYTSALSSGEMRSLNNILRLAWFSPPLWNCVDRSRMRYTDLSHLVDAQNDVKPGYRGLAADPLMRRTRAVVRSVLQSEAEAVHFARHVRVPRTMRCVTARGNEMISKIETELSGCTEADESLALKGECIGSVVGESDLHSSSLGKQLLGDLQLSYQAHNERSPFCLSSIQVPLLFASSIKEHISALEMELLLLAKQSSGQMESDLGIASTVYLNPTWRSILRAVCGKPLEAWPDLHADDEQVAVETAQTLARLYVLDDKFSQITRCVEQSDKVQLLRELLCVREWDWRVHPAWLAFEAEQGIRIWPIQYRVAKALLDGNHSTLAQLNVGMGKSSVILPMLLMHYSSADRVKESVRLHLLPTMLHETCATLASSVGQAVVGCTLFILPYSRSSARFDGISRVERFEDEMNRTPGSILCSTPDWRLSNELTRDERGLNPLPSRSYINILDESDLLLHYRYELVYALGKSQFLPDYRARVEMIQALLILTDMPPKGSTLFELLHDDKLVVSFSRSDSVNLCRDAPPELVGRFQRELGLAVLREDSRPSILKHEPVESCPDWVYDPTVSMPSPDETHACLLVLRGLLAGGILVECLKAQHRVSYGNPSGKYVRPGRDLAVPFRAAETPSLRADFVQPESQLVYTHLAHYNDGLSNKNLVRAIRELLDLGPTAQDVEFGRWRSCLKNAPECKIDCPRMFDVGNATQIEEEIRPHFARNRAVIDFWLRVVVLPSQTQQFNEQRSKSAWDLLNGSSRTIGFAGTNDIKPLLPLGISEGVVEDTNVQATNAYMVDCIREHTVGVHMSENSELENLVGFAVGHGCGALIDCGGILAGVSTEDVASAALLHHDAVTIFCIEKSAWMVFLRNGRVLTRRSSPTPESETFAIFDQGRCRGADLKLRPDCTALLTLGPKVTKAELVQAAGRMRGLGRGQKLVLTAMPDVWRSLRDNESTVSVEEVIRFAQVNTITSQRLGLNRWSSQGKNSALRQVQQCQFELSELYGQEKAPEADLSALPSKVIANRFAQINRRHARFLSDGEAHDTGADAECERELEQEEEKEDEAERQVELQSPREETAFIDGSGNLCPAEWLTMSQAVQMYLPRFSALKWPEHLRCSKNFVQGIFSIGRVDLYDYLRSLDMILVLPDNKKSCRVLLISNREAEQLLSASRCNFEYAIANWLTLRACETSASSVPMARFSDSGGSLLKSLIADSKMMAALSFFACEGKVPEASSSSDLNCTVRDAQDHDLIFEWFKLRNRHSHFSKSDAEDAVMRHI